MQVTGKAVMLDEIINYVQSLQRQVEVSHVFSSRTNYELNKVQNSSSRTWMFFIDTFVNLSNMIPCLFQQFLSMKLSTVNPQMEFDVDNFLPKDVFTLKPSL